MYYAVGQGSGRVYAVGRYKSNVFRILQADYPNFVDERKGSALIVPVLPETIIIKKGWFY